MLYKQACVTDQVIAVFEIRAQKDIRILVTELSPWNWIESLKL